MLAYVTRRLLQLVIVLFGVSVITFLMLYVIPGDPARMLAGKNATEEKIALIREQKGLDEPIYVQYGVWISGVLQGDLGQSFYLRQDVTEMIWENAPNTIQLALAAVLIELLGIPLGIYSALRQYTFWDTALTTSALIIWGIPVFVLGVFMQWFFGLKLTQWTGLDIFPLTGAGENVLWIVPASWASLSTLIL
ncbi:MAG: ABC transporter permease, partial [Actinomycetota bacterium]